MGTSPAGRIWEIDALRVTAMAMMVVYHVGYDVNFLAPGVGPDPYDGVWRALQVATGSTFLTLVGVSFWITHARSRARGVPARTARRSRARRGGQVVAGALAVSVATRAVLGPEDYVRFGILHVIAVLVLLVLPLAVRLRVWNAPLGTAVIGLGLALSEIRSEIALALVIGFDAPETGVDWYPLLPWAGPALVGLAIGALLYPDGDRAPALRDRIPAWTRGARLSEAIGSRSLPFYLVHQPVLIALTAAGLTAAGVAVELD